MSIIKDSGERREFPTGAVRDIQKGKGRCDLMPLDIVAELLGTSVEKHKCPLLKIEEFKKYGKTGVLLHALDCASVQLFGNISNAMLEVSKQFEGGAEKYGIDNWKKGIPVDAYLNSAVRHYLKHFRGDADEPHNRACIWNLMCALWTCLNKPELNVYANPQDVEREELRERLEAKRDIRILGKKVCHNCVYLTSSLYENPCNTCGKFSNFVSESGCSNGNE